MITIMKWTMIAVAIVGLAGCQTPRESANVNCLAVINLWSSPADPALTFKIKSDGSLSLLKNVRGKKSYCNFKLSNETSDSLLTIVTNAHAEIKSATKAENLAGGSNIRIIIGDDDAGAAMLKSYAQRVNKFKHVPALFEKLEGIAPEKYWRLKKRGATG